MITTMQHPVRGSFDIPGFPVQLESSPVEMGPAPLLGEHNAEVLREWLSVSDVEIESLEKSGTLLRDEYA